MGAFYLHHPPPARGCRHGVAQSGGKRVEGEIADHPVNLGLAKADVVEGTFLWTGKDLLKRIGIEPGEPGEVSLSPAPADQVEMPSTRTNALRGAGLLEAWEKMSPGKRRGLVHQVTSAKRPETQYKRIKAILDGLR